MSSVFRVPGRWLMGLGHEGLLLLLVGCGDEGDMKAKFFFSLWLERCL
jgi:hypothetical protein